MYAKCKLRDSINQLKLWNPSTWDYVSGNCDVVVFSEKNVGYCMCVGLLIALWTFLKTSK